MTIGVLALQGDFKEHLHSLQTYKVKAMEVRTAEDLKKVDALIMPGGESTTIAKLLVSTGLNKAIIQRSEAGMPIWGTCAGAILLSKKVLSAVALESNLGLIDVTIERNSYGRQAESFQTDITVEKKTGSAFFIRAPRILKVGRGVKIVATHDDEPIVLRQKNILISTCHTEMGHPNVVLEYFLEMIA
jgi:5'-phosphate synthase pdxT subunit